MIKNILKSKIIFFTVFLALIFAAIFNLYKPLPDGINYRGEMHNISETDIAFLYDLTYRGDNGEIKSEQKIFDAVFSIIDNAQKYILIDMFLFNSYMGQANGDFRALSKELTSKLIQKKREISDIKIDFITDPINIVYGGANSAEIDSLKNNGINIVITNL